MATKRQRRKRRRRREGLEEAPTRSAGPSAVAIDDAQRAAAARQRADRGKAPQALWGSFPLSELVVLVALILLVAGFFVGGNRGAVMMIVGLVLGALAGVELAAREHFAGYRSHNLLLAGAVGMGLGGLLLLTSPLSPAACAIAGALAFAATLYPFALAFRRRSGAMFRLRGE
jgi:hypothetical protein